MKKKNLLILSLTALMGMGLVGCGTPSTSTTDSESTPASSAPAPESSAPAPESSSEAPASSSSKENPASSSSSAKPASSSSSSSEEDPTGGAAQVTSIKVDSTGAKATYEIGETFSADGIVVTATYDDGTETTYAAGEYTATCYDASGAPVTKFTAAGEYTVVVTADGKSSSYTIKVNKQIISFADAMKKGYKNHSKVQSGTVVTSYNNFGVRYTENGSYKYGDNLSIVSDATGTFYVTEYDGEVMAFRDKDYDGNKITFEKLRTDYYREATGFNFYNLFYNNFDFAFYGVEEMVKGIYDLYDYYGVGERTVTEPTQANPNTYTYHQALDVYDSVYGGKVWDVTVTFDLDENEIFNNITVKTKRYSSSSVKRDDDGYFVEFNANTEIELDTSCKVTQVAGPQNAEFGYDLDQKFAESYKIKDTFGNEYNGTDTFNFYKGDKIYLVLEDAAPADVDFEHVDYIDVSVDDGDAIRVPEYGFNFDFTVFKFCLPVTFSEVGSHTITISTWNVKTTIHVKIERPIIPVAESEYYGKWKGISDDTKTFNIDKDGIHFGGNTYAITESTDQWVKGETADGSKYTFLVENGETAVLVDEDGIKYEIDRTVTKIKFSEWYGDFTVKTQNGGTVQSGWYCKIHEDGIHFMGADGVDHLYEVTKKESNKLYGTSSDPAAEVGANITVWDMGGSTATEKNWYFLGTKYMVGKYTKYTPADGGDEPEEPEEPAKTIADYYGCYIDTNNNPLVVSKDGLVLAGNIYPLKGLNADGTSIIYDTGDWLNPDGMIFIQADGTLKGLFPYNKAFTKIGNVPEGAKLDFSEYYGTYKNSNGQIVIDSAGITDDIGTNPVFYATDAGLAYYDTLFNSLDTAAYNAETKTITMFQEYVKEETTGGEVSGPAWASFYGTYVGDDGTFEINETEVIWGTGLKATIVTYQDGVLVARGMFGEERYTLQADGISFEFGGHIYTNQNPTTGGEDAGGSDSSAEPWKAYVGSWKGERGGSFKITEDGKVDLGYGQAPIKSSSTTTEIKFDDPLFGGENIISVKADGTLEYYGETFTKA